MRYSSLKIIAAFILVFIIVYLDPLQFGPFKWSQIWKSIFILFVFFRYFLLKKNKLILVNIYVLLSLNFLITLSFFIDPLSLLTHCLSFLFFPSIFLFFYYNYRSFEDYEAILKFSSSFVIVSFIPFYFGLLPELGKSYDLSVLGDVGSNSLVGLFQRPHSAALILSYASLTMLFFLQSSKSKRKRLFYILMFLLSVLLVLKTYVRTGLLMIIIGFFIFYFYKSTYVKKTKVLVITFIIGLTGLIITSSNEANVYEMRMFGETEYSGNSKNDELDLNQISSGRLSIWESSFASWNEKDSVMDILFGIGENELLKRNYQKIGFSVFSHNGFLDMLVVNGLVGLILFLLFLWKWYNIIKSTNQGPRPLPSSRLYALSVFFMYVISCFFQGGPIIYDSIFISSSILILIYSNRKEVGNGQYIIH